MKKISEILKEQGIDFTFPIEIKDGKGNTTYFQNSTSYWAKWEYNNEGNMTYWEDSSGDWAKWEYDSSGNETYLEYSDGDWYRYEYDDDGNQTYREDSEGNKIGTPRAKACDNKTIEVEEAAS